MGLVFATTAGIYIGRKTLNPLKITRTDYPDR
jgi:hypothetical protein